MTLITKHETFNKIPQEVIGIVMSYLPHKELSSLTSVSSKAYRYAQELLQEVKTLARLYRSPLLRKVISQTTKTAPSRILMIADRTLLEQTQTPPRQEEMPFSLESVHAVCQELVEVEEGVKNAILDYFLPRFCLDHKIEIAQSDSCETVAIKIAKNLPPRASPGIFFLCNHLMRIDNSEVISEIFRNGVFLSSLPKCMDAPDFYLEHLYKIGLRYGSFASLRVLNDAFPCLVATFFFGLSEKAREYNHPEAISWLATWNASKRSVRCLFTRKSICKFLIVKSLITFLSMADRFLILKSLDAKRVPPRYSVSICSLIQWNLCTIGCCAALPFLNKIFPVPFNRTTLDQFEYKECAPILAVAIESVMRPIYPTWLRFICGTLATIVLTADHRRDAFEI